MRKLRVISRLGPWVSRYRWLSSFAFPQRAEPCSSPGRVLRCSLDATRAITAYRPVNISRKRGVWLLHARGSGCANISLQAFRRSDRFMPGCQRIAMATAAHQISGRDSNQIHHGVGVFCNQQTTLFKQMVMLLIKNAAQTAGSANMFVALPSILLVTCSFLAGVFSG